MDYSKESLDSWKARVEQRYQALIEQLDGVDPKSYHSAYREVSQDSYNESHRFIHELDLRLAIEDLNNILKELKKLT